MYDIIFDIAYFEGLNLIEIENESYFYETLFWEEINKIYDCYLKEIDKKNNLKI